MATGLVERAEAKKEAEPAAKEREYTIPVVAQEITPDREWYPRPRHGVRNGVVR